MKFNRTLTIATLLTIMNLILSGCGSGSSNRHNNETSYQDTKFSLEDKEKQNPTSFLSCIAKERRKINGDWLITGLIINSATLATYKDVVLEIRFYSKTNSLLETKNITIYQRFPASKKRAFRTKVSGKNEAKIIKWTIVSAS